jgi:hypothetical protein
VAATASDAPAPAEYEEEAASRGRFHIPSAATATLVGVALSAWLLPAITKQWDDRRSAHELKASLVGRIAAASSNAFTGGRNALLRPHSSDPYERVEPGVPTPLAKWSAASIQIDAKLGAYLPASVVADWRAYSSLVTDVLGAIYARHDQSPLEFLGTPHLATLPAYTAAKHLLYGKLARDLDRFQGSRGPLRRGLGIDLPNEYGDLQLRLVKLEQTLGAEVLAAHPFGYSTSARDLLHDLVP